MARKNDSDVLELIILSFKSHFLVGYVLGVILFFIPELLMALLGSNMFLVLFIPWIAIFFKIAGVLCIIGGTYSLVTNPKNEKIIKGLAAIVCAALLTGFISSAFITSQPKEDLAEKNINAKIQTVALQATAATQKSQLNSSVSSAPANPASGISAANLESLEHNGKESLDRISMEGFLNRSLRPFEVKWNKAGTCQIKGLYDAMSLPGRRFPYMITAEQKKQIYNEQYPYVVDAFNHNCVIKLNAFELQNEAVFQKYMSVKSQISSEKRCEPYFSSINTATLSEYSDDIKLKHLSDILYDASVKQCLNKSFIY